MINPIPKQIHSAHTDAHTHTTVLRPFFGDYLGGPVPEENFWALWCKGRLTFNRGRHTDHPAALGAPPSGLTRAHLHHRAYFLWAGCPSCRPTNSVVILVISSKWCNIKTPLLKTT